MQLARAAPPAPHVQPSEVVPRMLSNCAPPDWRKTGWANDCVTPLHQSELDYQVALYALAAVAAAEGGAVSTDGNAHRDIIPMRAGGGVAKWRRNVNVVDSHSNIQS